MKPIEISPKQVHKIRGTDICYCYLNENLYLLDQQKSRSVLKTLKGLRKAKVLVKGRQSLFDAYLVTDLSVLCERAFTALLPVFTKPKKVRLKPKDVFTTQLNGREIEYTRFEGKIYLIGKDDIERCLKISVTPIANYSQTVLCTMEDRRTPRRMYPAEDVMEILDDDRKLILQKTLSELKSVRLTRAEKNRWIAELSRQGREELIEDVKKRIEAEYTPEQIRLDLDLDSCIRQMI